MSGVLLFVHGTGVRAGAYGATLRVISENARRHGVDLDVRGCYWAEAEGSRLLLGGRSIPGYAESGGELPTEAEELLALWTILYTDPWYELRLLRHLPVDGVAPFGEEPPAVRLRRDVDTFAPSEPLTAQLTEAGLADRFADALTALRASAELDQALATAPADPLDHRRAIGRALVAAALVAAEDAGEPAIPGGTRDALVERVTSELKGYGLGVGEFLLRPVKGLALRLVTRKLTGDRGSLSDAAAPVPGDIMRFLAHGDGARSYIRQAIADAGAGPVYLVAHSLGGIMCADLLIREAQPTVAALVTVGSQTPLLYEIGALPALSHPTTLPEHFPRWLNVYDRRDLLSYVADPVFPGRATDVELDNGQPFPQSHSAYWANPAFWAAIGSVVR